MTRTPTLRDLEAPRPHADSSFLWSDARLLGFGPMDETHKEFYEVALRMLTCEGENALAAVREFEAHAIKHFSQEEEWMRSSQFPPSDCHVEEHAAVLKSTIEVRHALEAGSGNENLARDFAMHLLHWFPGHADYLDSALSAWMSKHRHGGKPVVLRRKL